jgi:2-methylisocitrate lyase-like PEP mutase family enzyme
MSAPAERAFAAFRDLHRPGDPLLLPNAWDFASAAALVDAGFPAIGTTSLGVAAAYGVPDGRGAARAETVAIATRLGRLPCLLTVDIEGGFSDDPAEVAALAEEVAAAGAVGVNLEDGQSGGTLARPDHHARLITAVKTRVPYLFVNARTDVAWLALDKPPAIAEILARARAYRDAGADGIFVPGLAADADVTAVAAGVDVPLNVLFMAGRHTFARLGELGVARVSSGSLLFRVALGATVAAARAVATGGTLPADVPTYAEANGLSLRY